MVLYKYPQFFQQNQHQAFDEVYEAGAITPYSGIYRCEGCGKGTTSVYQHPLPPQNHHQHTLAQGRIRWRLAASHD